MENKEGKTFTDIFSSASDTNTSSSQTFTDILNSESEETKQILTFDNLFDKSLEQQTNYNFNEIAETAKNNDGLTLAEESTKAEEFDSFNSESPLLPPNLFFPEEEVDSESTTDTTSSTGNLLNSNPSLVNNNETSFIENPFFKGVNTSEIDYNPFFEESNARSEKLNPFFANNINDNNNRSSISTLTTTDNITSNEQTNTSLISEIGQPINPFFAETNTSLSEEKLPYTNNINDDNNPSPISTLTTTDNVTSNEQTNIPAVEIEKSISPFFETQNANLGEENPFFKNQINLIETQTPPSTNSNIDITKSKHYSVKVIKKKEPLIKTIIGILSYALFIWLLLVGVALLVYVLDIKIRAAKGDYSSPTFNAYVVLTGSMLPDIKVNDVVVTKKIDASKLEEGDIITFASDDSRFRGTIITHRIIKKNPPTENTGYTFQTKGDNNNVADNALVPENNIYGKVILNIPKLGYLQEFLATDGGWIVVILIPCLTVMSYDIVKIIKGIKRKKYKNIKVQK